HLDDVRDFFFKHYAPNNAVVAISGNISVKKVKKLAKKWYGDIPRREVSLLEIPTEKPQTETRSCTLERDVPSDAIYKVYHMCGRLHEDFYATDLLSDILSNGKSARLYTELVQKQKIFSEINA